VLFVALPYLNHAMSHILITGGTGILGRSLSALLAQSGILYTVGSRSNRAQMSNWTLCDLLKNAGVSEAVADKKIIFHLASDLKNDEQMTRNLLQAIEPDGGVHLIYMSIVGIDKVPFAYYKKKLAAEQAIKESGVPFTILRATQFHEFVHQIISTFLAGPVGFLPKNIVSQPIELKVVAQELLRLSRLQPTGTTYEIGGKEAMTLHQMARIWTLQSGKRRLILNLPIWGELGRTFANGGLTTPNVSQQSATWLQWLQKKYPSK
jgi:uncharacterized protein YbjT (DUF2867 family)